MGEPRYFSENPAPGGIRNRTVSSDIGNTVTIALRLSQLSWSELILRDLLS